jgi:hypothetical protein
MPNHLRTYIWEGEDAVEDGEADWCFAYGEEEWVNPDSHPLTGLPLDFEGYRARALLDTERRSDCE